MKIAVRNSLVTICLVFASLNANAVLLYDVDFNSDTVGTSPATGTGPVVRTTPSSVSISSEGGSATVVSSFGLMNDQPLRLQAVDNGPQDSLLGGGNVFFGLSSSGFSGFDVYDFQADFLTDSLEGTSGMGFFFNPLSKALRIEPNNAIRAVSFDGGPNASVGTYVLNSLITVGLTINLVDMTWMARIDGASVVSGMHSLTSLSGFRFGFTSHSNTPRNIYVDNILINGNDAHVRTRSPTRRSHR